MTTHKNVGWIRPKAVTHQDEKTGDTAVTHSMVPDSWTRVRLGNICKIVRGVSYKKDQASEQPAKGKVPILRATNIQDSTLVLDSDLVYVPSDVVSEEQMLRVGDIVVATSSGSKHLVGKTAQVKEPWAGSFGAFCAVLRPKADIDHRYLGYFSGSREYKDYISAKALGVNINNLRRGDLEEISVPIAPLDQQKHIVAEIEKQFSRLDEAVANLKRVKANLKRYKAAVLKAAVEGRLVETEAELSRKKTPSPLAGEGGGEGASYETGAQLLQRILETRRSQWKGKGKYKEPAAPDTTDLPELPEGWVWATAEQLGHVQLGRQRSPKNRSKDHPVKYIRAANITEAGLNLADVLDMEFLPVEQERYRLRRGDLLLSEASGSPDQVGKPAVWQDQLPLCCFQNTVIRLRGSIELSPYLLTCFQSYYVNGVFAKVASGVGINHLSADKFSRVQVPLPPLAEQHRIVAEVERCLSVAERIQAQVGTSFKQAERLRQAILGRAFSGKLSMRDIEYRSIGSRELPMAAEPPGRY